MPRGRPQKLHGFIHVGGCQAKCAVAARPTGKESADVDGRGKDQPLVVIRVVSQHLDTAGGVCNHAWFAAIVPTEFLPENVIRLMVGHHGEPAKS